MRKLRQVESRVSHLALQPVKNVMNYGRRDLVFYSDRDQGLEVNAHAPSLVLFPSQHRITTKDAGCLPHFAFLSQVVCLCPNILFRFWGPQDVGTKLGVAPGKGSMRRIGSPAGGRAAGSSILLSLFTSSCVNSFQFCCSSDVRWSESPTIAALAEPAWPSACMSPPFQAPILCCFGVTPPSLS